MKYLINNNIYYYFNKVLKSVSCVFLVKNNKKDNRYIVANLNNK